MKKATVILSAALTAFMLLILSGVLYSLKNGIRAAEAAPSIDAATVVQTEGSPALDQTLIKREVTYQDLIAQANTRLEQAQAEIERLQSQNAQVTPEEAAQIAASFTGQAEVYSVESIEIGGAMFYQATLSSGDVVLVSMSGEVLAFQPAPQPQTFSTGFFSDDEHEHETFEDED
jgi:hypothetical protein